MTTLKEIARAAGVSTTTVSNVINGNYGRVSAETIETVQRLIRESGYTPNQYARSLVHRGSRIVAVVVQADEGENVLLNPYHAAYVGALTVELYKHGYYPLLRFADDFHALDRDIRGWNVAGTLFSGSYNQFLDQVKSSIDSIPTVFTDCYFDLASVNYVGLDDTEGGRVGGDYLISMGHRRLGFIATNLENSEVDQQRLVGLKQSLTAHGLTIDESCIVPEGDLSAYRDQLADVLLRPDGPTAFFCCSDKIAIYLIQFVTGLGKRVPEDVSVLGFDDLPMASMTVPRLTTLAQDIPKKAAMSVDMLVRHIEDRALPPERASLGVTIVERDSVARIG